MRTTSASGIRRYHGEAAKTFGDGAWQASFFHDLVDEHGPRRLAGALLLDRPGALRPAPGRLVGDGALRDVPTLVFSEAMRDVDLFVGVTVHRDRPDAGPIAARTASRRYWSAAGFGALTASAEIRREVLARCCRS